MLPSLAGDLAYAARALRKSPGFAVAAIALLAAGIGGTATLFSLADALLFRTLALPRPAEMVRMVSLLPGRPPVSYYPYSYFEEWRARTASLSGTFAEADVDTSLTEGDSPAWSERESSRRTISPLSARCRPWAACWVRAMNGRIRPSAVYAGPAERKADEVEGWDASWA